MRRFHYFTALVLAAGAASACRPDEVIKTEDIPTAGVRFINAVPDSAGAFGLDFRWVDMVENNVQYRITFRNAPSTSGGVTAQTQTVFRPARAGARHFRIFLDDTLQNIATTVLKDSTVTLEAGKNYTAILWGEGRLGTMKLSFFEDTPADPASNVALRVINATNAAIDGRYYAQGGTAPAAATWASVPAYGVSSFVTATPGNYMFNIRAAGSATNMFNDLLALQGQAKTVDIAGTPGTTQAGSAVTLVVFPRSTAGARTPQATAFQVPAGAFMWDRRPPY
ncbi:MAG: DUF4397 domain-containing protein [Gemmatimonadota bacterium]|nr:DUF4397 domain-containing protein [Gemmatimonadota bacterium]